MTERDEAPERQASREPADRAARAPGGTDPAEAYPTQGPDPARAADLDAPYAAVPTDPADLTDPTGPADADADPAAPADIDDAGEARDAGGEGAPDGAGAAEGVAGLALRPALEAVLMVVDEPATEEHLAKVLGRPRRAVADAVRELADEYTRQGRGFELRLVAGGWRFYTRPEYAAAVEGFVLDGQQARLTQAALETLAVVAYRQPVSRSRVSAVRGVNCDGVMRTLLQRGLVEEAGTEPETGAILYRTTNYFLERMGLRGLDELPELAPFLPEVDAVEADSLEGVPSFDPDAPDDADTTTAHSTTEP